MKDLQLPNNVASIKNSLRGAYSYQIVEVRLSVTFKKAKLTLHHFRNGAAGVDKNWFFLITREGRYSGGVKVTRSNLIVISGLTI